MGQVVIFPFPRWRDFFGFSPFHLAGPRKDWTWWTLLGDRRQRSWVCEGVCTAPLPLGSLTSPSWARCGFNQLWGISVLAPMSPSLRLLITKGTGSEYQGRCCWAWRGSLPPSAIMCSTRVDPWARPSICPVWGLRTRAERWHIYLQERTRSSQTGHYTSTETHWKSIYCKTQITSALRPEHFLSAQMPSNSAAMGRSVVRGGEERVTPQPWARRTSALQDPGKDHRCRQTRPSAPPAGCL